MYYIVEIFYPAGTPFRAFFNNHLFTKQNAFARSVSRFSCEVFWVAGENVITIAWGAIPGEKEWSVETPVPDAPELFFQLVRTPKYGEQGKILFSKKLSHDDVAKYKGTKIPAYRLVLPNPTPADYSGLMYASTVCNQNEGAFQVYISKMRVFAFEIYKSLIEKNFNYIISNATPLIMARAEWDGSVSDTTAEFLSALKDIVSDGLAYSINDMQRFVFLPSCDGRLWRVGVMKTPKVAQEIMSRVSLLSSALEDYDHDLIQSMPDGGVSQKIPVYFGFPSTNCTIVR